MKQKAVVVTGLQELVRANHRADNNRTKQIASYNLRRLEASKVPAGIASNDAITSLPKRQPGREAGTQSNRSLETAVLPKKLYRRMRRVNTMFGGGVV